LINLLENINKFKARRLSDRMNREYTSFQGIDEFLILLAGEQNSAKQRIDTAQEKIDSINLYRRSLENHLMCHPHSPPIHLRAWEIDNQLLVSYEVRDYSLATAVKISSAPLPDQEARGLVWQIMFNCGEIVNENGSSYSILCRTENHLDDEYKDVRTIGVKTTYCTCSSRESSFSCPHTFHTNILQHKDPKETCAYYQKKGVTAPVISVLKKTLDDLFKKSDQEIFDIMQTEWIKEEQKIFEAMDALPEPFGRGNNKMVGTS